MEAATAAGRADSTAACVPLQPHSPAGPSQQSEVTLEHKANNVRHSFQKQAPQNRGAVPKGTRINAMQRGSSAA